MPLLFCPDGEELPDLSAATEDVTAAAAAEKEEEGAAVTATGTSGAADAAISSSNRAMLQAPLLPQQLVADTKRELLKLGFDVGAAPPIPALGNTAAAPPQVAAVEVPVAAV